MRHLLIIGAYWLALFSQGAFALPPNFRAWTALDKQSYHFEQVLKTGYRNGYSGPGPFRSVCASVLAATPSLLTLSQSVGQNRSDEVSLWRQLMFGKVIHRMGATASARLDFFNHSRYTGLFSGANILTTVRMGLAMPKIWPLTHWIPGMAIKIHVDGQEAQHIFAMPSLDGQKGSNLLELPYGTSLKAPERFDTRIGEWIFSRVVEHPIHQNLDHLGAITQDGNSVSEKDRRIPYAIRFIMSSPTQTHYGNQPSWMDFRTKLHETSTAFLDKHFMLIEAQEDLESRWVPIGTLRFTTPLTASSYGANKLWMNHQGFTPTK